MVDKKVFIQALLMTVLIFGIGLLLGLFIENLRSDNIQSALINSEVQVLDEQLRISSIGNQNTSCDFTKNNTFEFADSVYEQAQLLERYDSSHKFKSTFEVLHKRYDLLRVLLWSEIEKMNMRCGGSFHTIVYLYDYKTEDIDQQSLQNYFSRYLIELKKEYPNDVLLLPVAADLGLSSIDVAMNQHNITQVPAVIFDEKNIIYSYEDINKLKDILNISLQNRFNETNTNQTNLSESSFSTTLF